MHQQHTIHEVDHEVDIHQPVTLRAHHGGQATVLYGSRTPGESLTEPTEPSTLR